MKMVMLAMMMVMFVMVTNNGNLPWGDEHDVMLGGGYVKNVWEAPHSIQTGSIGLKCKDKDDGFVINLHKREGKSYDEES